MNLQQDKERGLDISGSNRRVLVNAVMNLHTPQHARNLSVAEEKYQLLKTGLSYMELAELHSCTVHVDSIKSFICPTNAHKLL